jgi:hypothetical protein
MILSSASLELLSRNVQIHNMRRFCKTHGMLHGLSEMNFSDQNNIGA